jgi:hypothetical protein
MSDKTPPYEFTDDEKRMVNECAQYGRAGAGYVASILLPKIAALEAELAL